MRKAKQPKTITHKQQLKFPSLVVMKKRKQRRHIGDKAHLCRKMFLKRKEDRDLC